MKKGSYSKNQQLPKYVSKKMVFGASGNIFNIKTSLEGVVFKVTPSKNTNS
jgi:hypothetical protein